MTISLIFIKAKGPLSIQMVLEPMQVQA